MADLSNKLNEILSDPQMMEQIKGLSSMLGMSGDKAEDEGKRQDNPEPPSPEPPISDDMIKMVMKFMPLLTSANQEDESTNLLKALKPLVGSDKRKKVDEAIKIMQMMKFLPLLKTQGIF